MSRVTSAPSVPQQQSIPMGGIARDKIAMRAYEKWCKRGRPHGSDKQDWAEAEMEIKAEMSRSAGQKR